MGRKLEASDEREYKYMRPDTEVSTHLECATGSIDQWNKWQLVERESREEWKKCLKSQTRNGLGLI